MNRTASFFAGVVLGQLLDKIIGELSLLVSQRDTKSFLPSFSVQHTSPSTLVSGHQHIDHSAFVNTPTGDTADVVALHEASPGEDVTGILVPDQPPELKVVRREHPIKE